MKIGILTQSINNNYGGILQNYALQTVLQRMGHKVETLNWDAYRCDHAHEGYIQQTWQIVKTFISRIILQRQRNYPWQQRDFFYLLSVPNRQFCKAHLHLSSWLWGASSFRDYTILHQFNALIVGSDQTWRPQYNKNGMLDRMFLDFTTGLDIKRIAYAASFGVDNWEYNQQQTIRYARLLKQFDTISVREESGIRLCQEHLQTDDVKHVLDPTLLLEASDYETLIGNCPKMPSRLLTTDILDNSKDIQQYIQTVAIQKQLHVTEFAPKYCNLGMVTAQNIGDYVSPSVIEWLTAFRNADYVICDSFHGTVFCIIFNKPFVTIGNRNRGIGRFNSLLSQFGLTDRLLEPTDDIITVLDKPINWEFVNKRRQNLKAISLQFLSTSLS